jgi:antitoxin (DNA-binding transcriptional repressor) of toxin-antitoxin stability system
MITAGAYYAKTHFSELLAKVAAGEQVQITKHNSPVARLIPEGRKTTDRIVDVVQELQQFRTKHRTSQKEISEMIQDGRR